VKESVELRKLSYETTVLFAVHSAQFARPPSSTFLTIAILNAAISSAFSPL